MSNQGFLRSVVFGLAFNLLLFALIVAVTPKAEAAPAGSYRITIVNQHGGPHDMEFTITEDNGGATAQTYKGTTLLGEAIGQFPQGYAVVQVGEQTQRIYISQVMVDATFHVTIPSPGPEWLLVHYRGQGANGQQLFGLYANIKVMYPHRWEVRVYNNGEQLCYCSVLSMLQQNAYVVSLPPGEQVLRVEARNFDTGVVFSFEKIVEVEAPAAVNYSSAILTSDSAVVKFWLDEDARFPQGTQCKITIQNSGAAFEGSCPQTAEEAMMVLLPEGENPVKIEAWNEVEQTYTEFQLTVPIQFHTVSLPIITAS